MYQKRVMYWLRISKHYGLGVVFIFVFLLPSTGMTGTSCPAPIQLGPTEAASIYVDTTHDLRAVSPTFFGFNLDLIAFQSDFWDKNHQRTRADLIEWLRAFPQAVYRYPGGTPANYFDWSGSVGPRNKRSPQKLVSYRDAQAVDFGFDEYMAFVKDAGGTPWLIVNLQGEFGRDSAAEKLSISAAQWAAYASGKFSTLPVLRWELGNELYIDKWSPQKYGEKSLKTIAAMSKSLGKGQFVAMLEDYRKDPYYPGLSLTQYNTMVAKILGQEVSEFALHEYYDSVGTVFIDSVQHRLNYVCQTIADIKKAKPTEDVGLWITETARWPRNEAGQNWNTGWWRTSTLEAGISVADMLIGTVQIPEVNGAFVHALASNTGPWVMFHTNKENQLYPSIIYLTLRLLREHLQEYVLPTKTNSPNISGYGGGYDIRAVALSNKLRTKFALWTINRSNVNQIVNLVMGEYRGKLLKGTQTYLSDMDINATNRDKKDRVLPVTKPIEIRLDSHGKGTIELLQNSVGVLDFSFAR